MNVTVACFTDAETGGGAATRARSVAVGLQARGHDVSLLSKVRDAGLGREGSVAGIATVFHGSEAGWAWRVPMLVRERRLADTLKALPRVPDVLLAVSPFYINAAAKAWPDVPAVFLFPCLLWRCLPFTEAAGESGLLGRWNHWLTGRAERRAMDHARVIIAQGPTVEEDIRDFHPKLSTRIGIAPTGVDDLSRKVSRSRDEVREDFSTPPQAVVALAVGRLGLNKNVGWIIEELSRMSAERPWLWVVGTGPQEGVLRRRADELGLADRIRFLGARADMPDVYQAADVLVHAAHYDNFPNVYLEAMVSGLAVVGPRGRFPEVVSPLHTMIEPGVQGCVYDLGKAGDLAGVLDTMAASPERTRQMGQAARTLALERYNWQRYVDAVEREIVACG